MKRRNDAPAMRTLALLILCLFAGLPAGAQTLPEPMVPPRLVNDFTGLLTEQQQIALSNKLLDFNNSTSTQIYVVTWDDLQGFDVADFGQRLGEKWGIGQKGKDNGILILISPQLHRMTIQTGYGVEGPVTDAIASRLINNVLTPAFKSGQYYEGLDSATNVLMSLTKGEFTADNYLKKGNGGAIPAVAIIIIIIILMGIFSGINRNKRRFFSPTHAIPWWLLLNSGRSSNSGWGSFSSGSGGFGGGGGGGFGSFGGGGGGSFGGGGASGGW